MSCIGTAKVYYIVYQIDLKVKPMLNIVALKQTIMDAVIFVLNTKKKIKQARWSFKGSNVASVNFLMSIKHYAYKNVPCISLCFIRRIQFADHSINTFFCGFPKENNNDRFPPSNDLCIIHMPSSLLTLEI